MRIHWFHLLAIYLLTLLTPSFNVHLSSGNYSTICIYSVLLEKNVYDKHLFKMIHGKGVT
jgi:hypothetical protein